MAINHDALVKERQGLLPEDREAHYIISEMIEPLIGGRIVGGRIDEDEYGDSLPFPVLFVEDIHGDKLEVIVSMDDEMNGGGRLILQFAPTK